jgi:hypothetical protein
MIATYTQTPTQTKGKTCQCGYIDCQGECCTLACPTRPNFFCGQVLTDEDLKALVDWTSAKSALQRFREGWGVSCGLEVTCSHEPKEDSRVVVGSGYAIDCCGRDIVVCDPIYYDFQCEKLFDPCRPPQKSEPQQPNQPLVPAPPDPKLGCIPRSELRSFELSLRFEEKLMGGQRALARGNCKPLDACQYTRVIETGKLEAKQVLDACVPVEKVNEKRYRDGLQSLLQQLEQQTTPETLLKWVQEKGGLHTFCFVEECLCGYLERQKKPPQNQTPAQKQAAVEADKALMAELRFYIVQDWRNDYFQCLCASCEGNVCEGDGVPLARVWLWNKTEGNRKICKVVQIDGYSPYRRLLRRDCRPYADCIDLSGYVWREINEVKEELFKRGFTITETRIFNPQELTTFFRTERNDYICSPFESRLIATTYPDVCGRQRVVAFGGVNVPPPGGDV